MKLVTRSKRPGMDCSIDVFFDRTEGFSPYINDKTTYKMIMIDGAWLHMDYCTTETSLAEGGIDSDLRTKVGKQ